MTLLKKAIATGAAACAICASPLVPAQTMDADTAWTSYSEMRQNAASAENILSGDVTNGFNMLGNVRDLILTPNGNQIEYVLYEVPFPYGMYGENDRGFVDWDDVDLEGSFQTGVDVRISDETEATTPQQLTLTARQAERRLVSNIIGEHLVFSDGQRREVEDILFDRNTGMVTSYIVQFDTETVFGEDTRRIPASSVVVHGDGTRAVTTPVTVEYQIWVP